MGNRGSGTEIAAAWSSFLAGWHAHDDAACLAALRAWLELWDEIFWQGDLDDLLVFYTEDCRVEAHVPILGRSFTGHDGIRAWRKEMFEVASGFRFDVDSFQRRGDRYAGTGGFSGTGRLSGLKPTVPWGVVWSLRGDLIATADAYPSRRAALRELAKP